MDFERLIFRTWFYLRIGYATYIAFALGFISNVIVIYKLVIVDTTVLSLFPHLSIFALVVVLVAVPISSLIGLLHMRRTGAYAADASVSTESNPYIFRVVPGKEAEVYLPLSVLTAKALLKMGGDKLSVEERQQFEKALSNADELAAGRPVGKK